MALVGIVIFIVINVIKTESKDSIPCENGLTQASCTNNTFIIETSNGFDDSMVDYAKMSILFGFFEKPNDFDKICDIIVNKFDERYPGDWGACIRKEGAAASCRFHYKSILIITYQDYLIKIYQTSK